MLLLYILFGALQSAAQDVTFMSVKGLAGFEQPEALLRQLVLSKRGPQVNTFCIVGYQDSAGIKASWVHWAQGNALILWEPGKPQSPLSHSRRYLNLRTDVVASDDQLKGSTYLATRQWVGELQSTCDKVGDKYTIRRSLPRKRP